MRECAPLSDGRAGMSSRILAGTAATLMLVLAACGGEELLSLEELQEKHGGASFTVTGAIEGSFETQMVGFRSRQDPELGPWWNISVAGNSGSGFTSPNLLFDGLGPVPGPGTYEFSGGRFLQESEMIGTINFFREDGDPSGDRMFVVEEGVLSIDERSGGEMLGRFDVRAREWVESEDGRLMEPTDALIRVWGDFRALADS